MKRNRKLLALTLSALMTAGLLAGCSAASSSAEAGDTASAAGTAAETGNPGGEDGVFTIAYAPNESNTEAADARNGLAEDLGADSLASVELVMALEEATGISIEDGALTEMKTVGDVMNYLNAHKQ